ncbi:MAG TPA: DUF1501 domain-containing protein [Tepidisphaeraceae bacterium]|nr:DUF1501 domain-containing protein [Tepidisphaeraceae bacterium]
MPTPIVNRRDLLKLSAAGLLTTASVPWFESVARAATAPDVGALRRSGKNCILLWMDGGPSQQHTFDPKPGGEFKSMPTAVPGIRIVEQLPKLAATMKDLALIRSMKTEINDHYDAKYYLHTGFKRVTGFEHPALGCIASHAVGDPDGELPAFVTIDAGSDKGNGGRLYRSVPAYLGARHAPLAVQNAARGLDNLVTPGGDFEDRLALLGAGEERFARQYPAPAVLAKQAAFDRAVRLVRSPKAKAFDLDQEPAELRGAYGRHRFGQSCLMARRLVEQGVKFVEIFHRGWDDHEGAAKRISERAPWMDAAMSTLICDLKRRGMLEDTLVIWMGEFGRSPGKGDGHFCNVWTTVWAGGGINTGIAVGKTNETGKKPGQEVTERAVTAPDFIATVCNVLGIDPHQEFMAPGQRPMPLVDKGATPIKELLA